MICYPFSKINLGLAVVGKRGDGYHNIESIFHPLPIYDALECIENKHWKMGDLACKLNISGASISGSLQDNLVVKAYTKLQQLYELPPVLCHLHKQIPMGAGLGGGSSDGAYMLTLLNQKFEIKLTQEDLEDYAAALGSDCPFFIYNQPMQVSGRGELMSPISISLKGYYFVLVYPNLHIGTAEAYSNILGYTNPKAAFDIIQNLDVEGWKEVLYNDFEKYAFQKFPALSQIKQNLYETGALYAAMTGSGSAIYGLYASQPDIQIFSNSAYQIFSGKFS